MATTLPPQSILYPPARLSFSTTRVSFQLFLAHLPAIIPSLSLVCYLSLLSGIPPFRLAEPESESETESNGTPNQEVVAGAILFDYSTVFTCSRGRRKTAMCAAAFTSSSSSACIFLVDGVWLCELCTSGCTGATSFTCQVSGSYRKTIKVSVGFHSFDNYFGAFGAMRC